MIVPEIRPPVHCGAVENNADYPPDLEEWLSVEIQASVPVAGHKSRAKWRRQPDRREFGHAGSKKPREELG